MDAQLLDPKQAPRSPLRNAGRFGLVWLAVAAWVTVVLAEPAAAQTAVMLPAEEAAEIPAADREAASDAVADALHDMGVAVIPASDARLRMLGEPFRDCVRIECAHLVSRAVGATFAVIVTVWPDRQSAQPGLIAVSLVDSEENAFGGEGEVQGSDVTSAARTALAQARQRQRVGELGLLAIRTSPAGATVELDGRVVGETPFRRMLEPKTYQLRLVMEGRRPHEVTVDVRRLGEQKLDITLETGDASAPDGSTDQGETGASNRRATQTQPSILNYVVAGGLAAASVPLLVSSISSIARDGDEVDDFPSDMERDVIDFGTRSAIFLGTGLAALTAAAVLTIVQPIQEDVDITASANGAGARIDLRAHF